MGAMRVKKERSYKKMKIELEGGTRLSFFQDLYREARCAADAEYDKMEKWLEQYKGSDEIDGSEERAKVVRNITYELVESQITGYLPNPKIDAVSFSDRNAYLAKAIETMISNKRNELTFESMNDLDERYTPIYGGSVWLVEWDESVIKHGSVGDIKVSCLSPRHFVGQPNIYNIEEMEYLFVSFETTKEDIVRKYGVTPKIADETESEESADDKCATLYVCYYKDDEDRICEYVWSGDTEILDLRDYYSRKIRICKKCGEREELCKCDNPKKSNYELQNEEYEELTRDIARSDGSFIPAMSEVYRDGQIVTETQTTQAVDQNGMPLMENVGGTLLPIPTEIQVPKTEPTKLPYYRPKHFPVVIRKNTSQEDSLFGQSDVEFIRPQQQAINKVESRILDKLLKGGVYPAVPDGCKFDLSNGVFDQVIKLKPGETSYGTIDLSVDISKDIAEAERLYDHAKRLLGISDSFQGQYDSSAKSGRAKQLQIQQAAGRLDSKRQMKNAAYAEMDRIIFEYYLAYADEPRPAVYRDAMGRMQNVEFNRYDFIERDEAGEWYYNDEFLFSCDATVDVDRDRETLWQENRLNFQQGAYGDPALPQTQLIFWLNMERMHYPFAHDNVERIKEEIARQQEIAALQQQVAERDVIIQQQNEEIQNRAEYAKLLISKMNGGQANAGARV